MHIERHVEVLTGISNNHHHHHRCSWCCSRLVPPALFSLCPLPWALTHLAQAWAPTAAPGATAGPGSCSLSLAQPCWSWKGGLCGVIPSIPQSGQGEEDSFQAQRKVKKQTSRGLWDPSNQRGGRGRVCEGEHLYTKWVRHLGEPRCSLKSEDLDLTGTHVNQRV